MVKSRVEKSVYRDYEYREITFMIFVEAECRCVSPPEWYFSSTDRWECSKAEKKMIKEANYHELLHIVKADVLSLLQEEKTSDEIYEFFKDEYPKKEIEQVLEWIVLELDGNKTKRFYND